MGKDMNAHTPGPWLVGDADDGQFIANFDARPVAYRMGQADARLIAAAPDMLAALQEVARHQVHLLDMGNDVWHRVRAAIAKAEGMS